MSLSARLAVLALALFSTAQAGPLINIKNTKAPTVPNGYIVSLKPNANLSAHRDTFRAFKRSDSDVTYEWPRLNAYSGTFSEEALSALRQSDDVAAIEYDTIGRADALVTQTNTIWNLQRISQVAKLPSEDDTALIYNYTYDDSAGAGVDIYILDSGININHTEFGGRASWGKTFGGYSDQDVLVHGTHVAGTAGGTVHGIAKKASLIAVRVLSDTGHGALSDGIAAVDWVIEQAINVTRRPTVINMSLRYDPSDALDAAVTNAINAGVHVVTSAGNDADSNGDTQSPARAEAVISVGATNILDERSEYSNWGPKVDIFAPGDNILSSIPGTGADINNATDTLTGTSMASPHVAGLVAYLIGLEGNKPPRDVLARLKELSPDGILSNMPSNTNNELANNGASL